MLVERGAERVVAFDIAPKPADAGDDGRIVWMQGDLTKPEDVLRACEGSECVWHIAALVGPYHPLDMYMRVNYDGTVNVIDACKSLGIRKIVMSSSPSTRFHGGDINGAKESELTYPKRFLQAYAESKAKGEEACMAACDGETLFTVAVAPHQVYGPRDFLFLHNFLLNARRLRVFGSGKNLVSVCFVDNYCHGLIIAERKLHRGSPALGKFYICTDGAPVNLWRFIDRAIVDILPGAKSLFSKLPLPGWSFMYPLGYACENLAPRWAKSLTTFSGACCSSTGTSTRGERGSGYEPIVAPDEAWTITRKVQGGWLLKHGPRTGGEGAPRRRALASIFSLSPADATVCACQRVPSWRDPGALAFRVNRQGSAPASPVRCPLAAPIAAAVRVAAPARRSAPRRAERGDDSTRRARSPTPSRLTTCRPGRRSTRRWR